MEAPIPRRLKIDGFNVDERKGGKEAEATTLVY